MDNNIFDEIFEDIEKGNASPEMYGFDVFEEDSKVQSRVSIMDSSLSISSEDEVFITRHILRIYET